MGGLCVRLIMISQSLPKQAAAIGCASSVRKISRGTTSPNLKAEEGPHSVSTEFEPQVRIGVVGFGTGGLNFYAPFIEAADGVE
jgi:hypothetical protein